MQVMEKIRGTFQCCSIHVLTSLSDWSKISKIIYTFKNNHEDNYILWNKMKMSHSRAHVFSECRVALTREDNHWWSGVSHSRTETQRFVIYRIWLTCNNFRLSTREGKGNVKIFEKSIVIYNLSPGSSWYESSWYAQLI